jgi:hypothetical protein
MGLDKKESINQKQWNKENHGKLDVIFNNKLFETPDTHKITIWGQGSKLGPNRQKTFFA